MRSYLFSFLSLLVVIALYACNGEISDADGDGYTSDDCDDSDAAVYPGANETPYDGIDQDCDGADLADIDGDGFEAEEAGGEDCDDNDSDVNPDAVEIPDEVDNDCDGEADNIAPLLGKVLLLNWPEDAAGYLEMFHFIAFFADTIAECEDPFNELYLLGLPSPKEPEIGEEYYVEYSSIDFWWDWENAEFYSVGETLYAQSGDTTIEAYLDTQYAPVIFYYSSFDEEGLFLTGETYALSAEGDDIEGFTVNGFLLPEDFEILSPDYMEYLFPVFKGDGLTVEWVPQGEADGLNVYIWLFDRNTGNYFLTFQEDSLGEYTIPPEFLTDFSSEDSILLVTRNVYSTFYLKEFTLQAVGRIEYWFYPYLMDQPLTCTPSFGVLGQTLDVEVAASNANFVDGTTEADFGQGIMVNSVDVSDADTATVNITIRNEAATGERDVTMTTGPEVIVGEGAFSVEPAITCNPDEGGQGETLDVLVTAPTAHFVDGTTTADFGSGIVINSVTVHPSGIRAVVNISIEEDAPTGGRDLTMTTGTEVIYQEGAFTVTPG